MIDEKKFNRVFSTVLMSLMAVAIIVTACFKFEDLRGDTHGIVMLALASVASMTGVISTVLSANGAIMTFIFGTLNAVLVAAVALDNGIMGNFALHAFYFLPMQFVGIWQWRRRGAGISGKGEKEKSQVQARRMTPRLRIVVALALVAATAVAYFVLCRIDGTTGSFNGKAFLDAAVFTFNVGGQVLMSFAYMEQWVLWNLVNISSIGLWGYTTWGADGASGYTIVMFIKYCFYFVNSLNGLRIWLNLSKPRQNDEFA